MTLYHNKYRIESTRLKDWDYSHEGYYFFTICTKNRNKIFGEIRSNQMLINEAGQIVRDCWYDLPNHYPNLLLDEFIVMPDHVHGIILIIDNNQANNSIDGSKDTNVNTNLNFRKHGLAEFIRALKSFSARRINEKVSASGIPIWQTRFHDHIIHDKDELCRIRKYIKNNPLNWQKDDSF